MKKKKKILIFFFSKLIFCLFAGQPEATEVTGSSVNLIWAAPKSDGGSPIVHYCIQYRDESSLKWKLFYPKERSAELHSVVNDLKENTVYNFRVAAENRAGVGPYSEPSEPVRTPIMGDEPQMLEGPRDIVVVAPDSAIFEAKINGGTPRADVTWYKGDKSVRLGSKMDTSYEGEVAKLEVRKTEVGDAGIYRIEAKNKVGKVSCEAKLTVHGKRL